MTGHVRKRGRDSYELTVELSRDAVSGRRRRRFHTVHGTRKDADRELIRLLRERDTGIDIDPHGLTLADYLKRWLRDYAEPNVRASTLRRYRDFARRFTKALGTVPLKDLRPAHVQGLYGTMLETGLAPQTVLLHHRCLKLALKHAVEWELVHRNVAEAVKPPRAEPRAMRVLDAPGVERLIDQAPDDLRDLIYVSAQTGLRQGEQLALRWADLDLDRATLTVRRTIQYVSGEGLVYGAPKSASSRRTIDLSAATLSVLRRGRSEQAAARLRAGAAYRQDDLVFADALGRPINPHQLSTRFRRFVARTEFVGLRWHDLRHTHATLLLLQGAHTKAVADRLGHANAALTLNVYSHVLPGVARDTAQMLDAILPPPEKRTG